MLIEGNESKSVKKEGEAMLIKKASWIMKKGAAASVVPVFRREFSCKRPVWKAVLEVTCAGVYDAVLNGERLGKAVLSPGWTEYHKRLQVQSYNVTSLVKEENVLDITVANGWFRRANAAWTNTKNPDEDLPAMMIAVLRLIYPDGSEDVIYSDDSWQAGISNILLSGIFDGEDVDARIDPYDFEPAAVCEYPKEILIPQEGPEVFEQEIIRPRSSLCTPKGEWVLDFGQNLTGYMYFEMDAQEGEKLSISTAEVLDADGNFYTGNYRFARSKLHYICKEGHQSYKPRFTFFGFRYLRLDDVPKGFKVNNIYAIVLHSEMTRTGWLTASDPMLDQLFSNILWGQKGNYLEVPTDCPQRDERYGWTGDGQLFTRAASYQYDVRKFFRKWLADMRAAQREDGWVPEVIPTIVSYQPGCAGWSDACTIIPWQLYETYGDVTFLSDQFECMKAWVDYVGTVTKTPDLWTGCWTYGDWLALDHPEGYVPASLELSKRGYSDDDLVSSAYYANSVDLVVRAGKILGQDVEKYEQLHSRIRKAFIEHYGNRLNTQTEKVLALHFHLTDEPRKVADALAKQVIDCGMHLQTGLLGTAYLLHVLSEYGYTKIAWNLLLRREYPGWLYSVSKGATTLWEHWDGIKPDGTFWSDDMNSFNHYAYGSVADWVYNVACGITPAEPGFAKVKIAPHPDERLDSLSAVLDTVHGRIRSAWRRTGDGHFRYEIDTPVETQITIGGKNWTVEKGSYIF